MNFIIVIFIILCILFVIYLISIKQNIFIPKKIGGADKGKKILQSENIIIDTLNLTHWFTKKKHINTSDIIRTIDKTAPIIKQQYPGRVIYVIKTRDKNSHSNHSPLKNAAHRNNIFINVVEKLDDNSLYSHNHTSLGRDDFYIIMLAWKYKCPVLSKDKYHDLKEMKSGNLAPFHVYKYSYLKKFVERDFVNPSAAKFKKMKRPLLIKYEQILNLNKK